MANPKPALGKGLSALISSENIDLSSKGFIPNLPVDQISPNPHQPRMSIKPEDLIEIADSIRENGVIQPLIVTKRGDKDYVLIAGERRWRAAQLAGTKTVPVVVREASPKQMLELAVIENVQRKDLNPVEEALAFKQLVENFDMSHSQIGQKVGLSRVAIVNKIRLLKLPEKVKQLVLDNILSEGHARALLGIGDPDTLTALANVVIKKGLSVHETEELVRKVTMGAAHLHGGRPRRLDNEGLELEEEMKKRFAMPVQIIPLKGGGGKITIKYRSRDELGRIYELMMGK